MGEVFEAVRTGPGGFRRAVALKRLIPGDAVRGAAVQRFLAEARILSNLHHRNVIEVHEVIESEQGYVLVMELLTGVTLNGLMRATERLPTDALCVVADQALAGLDYIHQARGEDGRPLGLIHRDLTPSNLFVTDGGEVKLIDFGIAKVQSSLDAPLTRTGEIHGTLEMIAPEIARGEPADRRTDLYQLAASLYWALTGTYPHGEGTTVELVARAAHKRPPLLASLRSDLPPALVATIDRAMALEPAERFDSAADMRAELRGLVPSDGDARLAARVRAALDKQPREPAAEPAVEESRPPTAAPATVADKSSVRRGDTHPPDDAPATIASKPRNGAGARALDRVPRASDVRRDEAPRMPDRGAGSRRRRRWPIFLAVAAAGGAAGGVVLSLKSGPEPATPSPGSGSATTTAPPIAEVPNTRGAVAAVPLSDGRIAVATAHAVQIVSERGGAPTDLAMPAGTLPIDVEALAGDHVAITVQRADGGFQTLVDGDASKELLFRLSPAVIAVHPDGTRHVRADLGYSAHVEGKHLDSKQIVKVASGELVLGLAWSPDGKRVAALHDHGASDPTFDLIDVDAGTSRTYTHVPLGGDVGLFGWLDPDHLVYAVNRADRAELVRVAISTMHDEVLVQLPKERITGGHVNAGAIAFLHAPWHTQLQVGTTSGLHGIPIANMSAGSLAGIDPNGHLVLGSPDAAPIACSPDGRTAPVPGGAVGDRTSTVVDGTVLVVRGGDLVRLGTTARRLATTPIHTDIVPARCAGDATPPCVAVSFNNAAMSYRVFDSDSGAMADSSIGERRGVDHAVSPDGAWLVIADRTDELHLYNVATHDLAWRKVGGGASLEAVAWSGSDVIVAARHWRQHSWALLAVDAKNEIRTIAQAETDRMPTSIRASKDMIAVLASDAAPVLSIVHP